jgi:hypothetical protein
LGRLATSTGPSRERCTGTQPEIHDCEVFDSWRFEEGVERVRKPEIQVDRLGGSGQAGQACQAGDGWPRNGQQRDQNQGDQNQGDRKQGDRKQGDRKQGHGQQRDWQ